MSCYIGIEVVLAGDNEESVRNATIEVLNEYCYDFSLDAVAGE